MTGSGVYRTMDLTEIFEAMPEVSTVLRLIIDPGDPDPNNATSQPFLAAVGTLTVSTDHSIALRSDRPVWDVNGYYRALGITWPYRPTKVELREAYQRMRGEDDRYATYALKRLLDPAFREFYDERELGNPVDDLYRWEELQRRAFKWAKKETERTGEKHSAEEFAPSDIRARMKKSAEETPARRLDYAPSTFVDWPYGYYLWETRHRDDCQLAAWQELVRKACWNKGLRVMIAVGYFDVALDAAAVRYRLSHPDVDVILLRAGRDATPELADVVAGSYYAQPQLDIGDFVALDSPD